MRLQEMIIVGAIVVERVTSNETKLSTIGGNPMAQTFAKCIDKDFT